MDALIAKLRGAGPVRVEEQGQVPESGDPESALPYSVEFARTGMTSIHTPETIVSLLRRALKSPSFQPEVLPSTALRLLEMARDPEIPIIKVREVIEGEPVLAAAMLRTANSSFYSRGAAVESLDDALVRLGVDRVAGIFMETAMRSTALSGNSFKKPFERLRRHMVATGHIARGVCRSLKRSGERAFVCGILHDIGVAGSLTVLGQLPKKERPKDYESIRAAVEQVHEEASAIMGEKWNLPWGIQWVIGHHHSYHVDGRVNPLAALIALSDWLATECGAPAIDEVDEEGANEALAYFGFGASAKGKLQDRCKRIVEGLE